MLESLKGMFVSEKSMKKRMRVVNGEVCDSFAENGISAIYLTGHCANWEWAIIIDKYLKHKIVSVFKPLKNKTFNSFMKKNRERFGMKLLSMQDTRKAFEVNSPIGLVLIADQSPGTLHNAIWVNFFNRDTPCIHGPEAYAKRFNIPLIFIEFQRVKRGYYYIKFFRLIDEPSKYKKGEITQIYMKRLEEYIRRKPEYWAWTHKRWKHKRNEKGEILRDYYYKK
jgi:KDO2-lipid IV(A) lauroyltransferase